MDFKRQIKEMHDWCRFTKDSHQAFDEDDLSNAVTIFFHVASNMAFDFHSRNLTQFGAACDANKVFGAMIREMLIRHTGVDLADTQFNELDAQVLTDD